MASRAPRRARARLTPSRCMDHAPRRAWSRCRPRPARRPPRTPPGEAPVRPRAGTRSNSSSSPTPSVAGAASATICWARTSSGCSGGWRASRRPRPHRGQQRRALDQLVPRGAGTRPWAHARALVAGRPTRCRKVAIDAASRSGTPARPARRRCRARARRWPPAPADRRLVAAAPRAAGAAPATASRDGRPPGPLPAARRADAPPARTASSC